MILIGMQTTAAARTFITIFLLKWKFHGYLCRIMVRTQMKFGFMLTELGLHVSILEVAPTAV